MNWPKTLKNIYFDGETFEGENAKEWFDKNVKTKKKCPQIVNCAWN